MYEDKQYITFSSYWDDIVVTGLVPILILAWLNLKIYLKVRKMHNEKLVVSCYKEQTFDRELLKLNIHFIF